MVEWKIGKVFTGAMALLPERGGGGGLGLASADSSEEIFEKMICERFDHLPACRRNPGFL